VGGGSTFSLTLPIHYGAASETARTLPNDVAGSAPEVSHA
jgi:hypothetical protein